jgi:hypothetical protein
LAHPDLAGRTEFDQGLTLKLVSVNLLVAGQVQLLDKALARNSGGSSPG